MAQFNRKSGDASGGMTLAELTPLPDALLDDPLGFIDADHARQRAASRALLRLAVGETTERALAVGLANFLVHDLPLHHRDEDEDLFPLLLKRALPEDDLGTVVRQLTDDHISATQAARVLAQALDVPRSQSSAKLDGHSAELAREFATSAQRHLAVEAAIIMVMARKRLKSIDLNLMARSMRLRRGVAA